VSTLALALRNVSLGLPSDVNTHAVGGARGETSVAHTADLLVALRTSASSHVYARQGSRALEHRNNVCPVPSTKMCHLCLAHERQDVAQPFAARYIPQPLHFSKRTLYLLARTFNEGSMIPPRRRRTRWRVDSFWMSVVEVVISMVDEKVDRVHKR
jgi:hypothetical protein